MCRKLRGVVPITRDLLKPSVPDSGKLRALDKKAKDRQKDDHDRYHRVKQLPPLTPGDRVWIPDRKEEALVGSRVAPCSLLL